MVALMLCNKGEPVPQEQSNFLLPQISRWFGVRTKGLL
jgi:hypothetical protein